MLSKAQLEATALLEEMRGSPSALTMAALLLRNGSVAGQGADEPAPPANASLLQRGVHRLAKALLRAAVLALPHGDRALLARGATAVNASSAAARAGARSGVSSRGQAFLVWRLEAGSYPAEVVPLLSWAARQPLLEALAAAMRSSSNSSSGAQGGGPVQADVQPEPLQQGKAGSALEAAAGTEESNAEAEEESGSQLQRGSPPSSALAVSVLAMRVAGGAPWPAADNITQVGGAGCQGWRSPSLCCALFNCSCSLVGVALLSPHIHSRLSWAQKPEAKPWRPIFDLCATASASQCGRWLWSWAAPMWAAPRARLTPGLRC